MRYEGWGKAVTKDGWMEEMPEGMVVRNAREVTLYYAIRSSFAGYDKHPELEGCDPSICLKKDLCCDASYERIRERHLEEYQHYYNRVSL